MVEFLPMQVAAGKLNKIKTDSIMQRWTQGGS